MIILVLVYHILCFSGWMTDPDVKVDIGFSFIAIVMSILVAVHGFAVWSKLFKLCKRIKRKRRIKSQTNHA